MEDADWSVLNMINQSDWFTNQIENGATSGETFFTIWNTLFFDFQILLFLFLLIQIWGRYFYTVSLKFYEKTQEENIEKFRNRKSWTFYSVCEKLYENVDENDFELFGKLKLLILGNIVKFRKLTGDTLIHLW